MLATEPKPDDERVTYAIRGCQRCGEDTRAFVTIGDKDFCEDCVRLMGLDQFCDATGEP